MSSRITAFLFYDPRSAKSMRVLDLFSDETEIRSHIQFVDVTKVSTKSIPGAPTLVVKGINSYITEEKDIAHWLNVQKGIAQTRQRVPSASTSEDVDSSLDAMYQESLLPAGCTMDEGSTGGNKVSAQDLETYKAQRDACVPPPPERR